jgi:integrase
VALLRLAFDLALRISELARLDLADVDLKNGRLWITGKEVYSSHRCLLDVEDLRGLPLHQRKRRLARIMPHVRSRVRLVEHTSGLSCAGSATALEPKRRAEAEAERVDV